MVLPLIDFNCQNLCKFIYKLSEHATPAAIEYLQNISAGPRWAEMLTSYLRLEKTPTANVARIFYVPAYFFY